MRVVFLAMALVAGVSAVQHAPLTPALIKEIAGTKFGESILLELQESTDVAPSLQGLYDLVADIRARVEGSQEADTARHNSRMRVCDADILSLGQKINNTILAIKTKQGQIAESSMQIGRLERAIVEMERRIVFDRAELHKNRVMLGNNSRIRSMDNAIYQQRIIDTDAAQAAVKEILDLDWSVLTNNQDDHKDNFADKTLNTGYEAGINEQREVSQYTGQQEDQNVIDRRAESAEAKQLSDSTLSNTLNTYYPASFAERLSTVAQSMHDKTAMGLLQVAAAAVQGMGADDVDRLKALLNKLAAELEQYETDLHTAENTAAADWVAEEVALRKKIADWEKKLEEDIREKIRLTARKADATAALSTYQEQWSGFKEQVTGNPEAPGALEVLLTATQNECNHWIEQYENREETRTQELATISQIETILRNRMDNYHNGDDQIKFSTNGTDSAVDYGTPIPGLAANEYSEARV